MIVWKEIVNNWLSAQFRVVVGDVELRVRRQYHFPFKWVAYRVGGGLLAQGFGIETVDEAMDKSEEYLETLNGNADQ